MSPSKHKRGPAVPKRHHIDRRADQAIAAGAGDDDDLLSTIQVAAWLGCSTQWLEIARHRGFGPPFVKMGERLVRYRRGGVKGWLQERQRTHTAEYTQRVEAR